LFIPLLGIISQVRDARRLRMFLWAWMAGVGHIAYNGVTMWLSKGGRADDVGGQAGDANWLAMICVCVAPLALAMFIVEKKPLFRWGGLGAAGFYAMGVIASGSRGGLLALILGVGIWFVQTNKKGIAAGIMALAVGGFLLVAPESFWERMGTMFLGAENNPWIAKEHEASAQSRKIFWKLALTVFEESPFLGIGPMNIPEEAGERVWFIDPATGGTKYMTHNTWLQLLAEYGLFGSTFWIGGYLLSLWCVFRASMIAKQKLKDDPNYYWMPMYCVGLFAGWVANALAITFVSCQWLDYNYWIIVTGPLVLQIVRESAARSEWFGQRAPEAPAHAVAKRAARPMPVRAG
jgi:O-antigen ligase